MINLLSGIAASSSALDAERMRMEVISQNIANANTVRGVDGRPYQRQMVVFENVLNQQPGMGGASPMEVKVSQVVKDQKPFRTVHDPKHPLADANGVVNYPNVDLNQEMVDMISANRSYEANVTMINSARQMFDKALSIGR